jgi:hypothetical protein
MDETQDDKYIPSLICLQERISQSNISWKSEHEMCYCSEKSISRCFRSLFLSTTHILFLPLTTVLLFFLIGRKERRQEGLFV